jgi:hypothetical protein
MRHKKLKLNAFIFLGLGLTGLQAQTMYVKESNGTPTAYSLNNIQKMSFSSGNLIVAKTDNNSNVYALSDLMNLKFPGIITALNVHLPVQNQNLSVYPNPVGDILNINLAEMSEAEGTLSILNFEGKTMVTQQVSNENVLSLNISRLPTGIYLCRYSNASEIRTVKIIKQ